MMAAWTGRGKDTAMAGYLLVTIYGKCFGRLNYKMHFTDKNDTCFVNTYTRFGENKVKRGLVFATRKKIVLLREQN